jgi:hypothetical protein
MSALNCLSARDMALRLAISATTDRIRASPVESAGPVIGRRLYEG